MVCVWSGAGQETPLDQEKHTQTPSYFPLFSVLIVYAPGYTASTGLSMIVTVEPQGYCP